MHPQVPHRNPELERFVETLRAEGFEGEIETGFAAREVLSTDNSIYRVLPRAAVFPRRTEDIAIAVRALAASGDGLSLTARGGGTGTNGQSLNDGVVLDTSRHLTRILDFDPESETVTVEPGVVLDQLNSFLAPHGFFFPPMVSTATRATIGGMIATDASGKGSRIYGRTSDYVLGMDVVLADGTEARVEPLDEPGLREMLKRPDRLGDVYRRVHPELEAARPAAEAVFPRMNRGLTGYNLKEALPDTGGINLCKLMSGSEGTLALTGRVTLKVRRKPPRSGLVVLFYDDFAKALGHVPKLVEADPLAVEILDDKILSLARQDPVWTQLGALFGEGVDDSVKAVNFVEVVGETEDEVAAAIARIERHVAGDRTAGLARPVLDPAAIRAAWSLREKAVGLLGALEGRRTAIPFVEDTAVPPENLAAYVAEFRALLDGHGVAYGMFGHADVGCLHVRPTIDMTDRTDQQLIRRISDEVARLTKAYGGLLWGEHGRGVRGEYSPLFFGPELYPVLRRVKAVFDPGNRFNPGKLAVPEGTESAVARIDQVPFRGSLDATIPAPARQSFAKAVACNGNGVCHSWNPADPLCPSYKATRDKTQSPNGRSALFRAWARDPSPEATAALKASLDTCLSCRACASACPVKVDIPTMKARFLETYYRTHRRPLRDRIVRVLEPAILTARRVPRLANLMLHNPVSAALTRALGFADLPAFADPLERALKRDGVEAATDARLARLSPEEREKAVILLPDTFLASFDTGPILAAAKVLRAIGRTPLVAPVQANGKALEVRGFNGAFARTRDRLQARLAGYAKTGIPVVAIEPATLIQARSDGATALLPLDRFLRDHASALRAAGAVSGPHRLFLHCTEKTADTGTGGRWQEVFRAAGIPIEIVDAGCCGMSGLFGHEREHRDLSRRIFELSWAGRLDDGAAMATGFSCRCQAKRFAGARPPHPVEILARAL